MQCPYLKHINFTKIDIVQDNEHVQDTQLIDLHMISSPLIKILPDEAPKQISSYPQNDASESIEDPSAYTFSQILAPNPESKKATREGGSTLLNICEEFSLDENSRLLDKRLQESGSFLDQLEEFVVESQQILEIQPYVLKSKSMGVINTRSEQVTQSTNAVPYFKGKVMVLQVGPESNKSAQKLNSSTGEIDCLVQHFYFKLFHNNKVLLFLDFNKYNVSIIVEKNNIKLHVNCHENLCIKIQCQQSETLAQTLNYYIRESGREKRSDFDSLQLQVETTTFQRLAKEADTFDIILFKNKTFMSKVQRFFTNSNYDHVAMLLRSASQQIFVLQCTSTLGVGVYPLRSFSRIDCMNCYDRLCYRKLEMVRSTSHIEKLERFVRTAIGKTYKFDPRCLVNPNYVKEPDTYFCSDLVAKALQEAGILDPSIPSHKFLPKHFCDEEQLKLTGFARYGQSVIIQSQYQKE